MALGHKLAYNVAVNVFAKAGSTVLALVGIGMVTRYLGPNGFGSYATVLAFFALFSAIGDFGLYSITAREIGRADASKERHLIDRIFTLRLITALLVMVIAIVSAKVLPYEPAVRTAIAWGAVAYFFSSSYGFLNSIFQKNLSMDRVVITELFGKALQILWIGCVIAYDGGLLWIVGGVVAAMFFNFVTILWFARTFVRFRLVIDVPFWKEFLKHAYPMGVAAIITFLYFKADTILLSFWQSDTAVGIYGAAYKVMENLIFFPSMVMGLMLPILSRTIFTERKEFEQFANKTLKVFLLIITPIVIGIFAEASDIMRVVGGEAFVVSAPVLRLLSLALLCIFFGQFFTIILVTGNLQKKLMYALSVCAIINILGNTLLIPKYSYMGSAIMSVVTECAVVVIAAYIVHRYIGYTPRIPQGWRITLAGCIMACGLLVFHQMPLFVTIIFSAILYCCALWMLKAITLEELRKILLRNPT